jgi:hypothetical protein
MLTLNTMLSLPIPVTASESNKPLLDAGSGAIAISS